MNIWKTSMMVLVFALFVGMLLVIVLSSIVKEGKKEDNRNTVIPTVTVIPERAHTALTAIPSKTQLNQGEAFMISISIDTSDNLVTGIQLAMRFDPRFVEVKNITSGDFFIQPIEYAKKIDSKINNITYAIGSFQEKQGTGVVAQIEAVARQKTSVLTEVLTIEGKSIVTEIDNANSVLKDAKGASIVIR